MLQSVEQNCLIHVSRDSQQEAFLVIAGVHESAFRGDLLAFKSRSDLQKNGNLNIPASIALSTVNHKQI